MKPLVSQLRPTTLDEFIGQQHLVGPGKPLRTAIEKSMFLALFFGVHQV